MKRKRVVKVKIGPRNRGTGRTDWKRLRAMTEEEIESAARSDPDNPPLTQRELKRMRRVSPVKVVRHRLGMTQAEFAAAFHLSLATVRDWEQGRYRPDQSARTYLRVIAAMPEAVKEALRAGSVKR